MTVVWKSSRQGAIDFAAAGITAACEASESSMHHLMQKRAQPGMERLLGPSLDWPYYRYQDNARSVWMISRITPVPGFLWIEIRPLHFGRGSECATEQVRVEQLEKELKIEFVAAPDSDERGGEGKPTYQRAFLEVSKSCASCELGDVLRGQLLAMVTMGLWKTAARSEEVHSIKSTVGRRSSGTAAFRDASAKAADSARILGWVTDSYGLPFRERRMTTEDLV